MKKRILAVIMAVCVSMTALPADVRAAEDGAVQTESTQAMETSSAEEAAVTEEASCRLYTSPSPRDGATSRMPSSA